ncbi:MAG: type III secretion system protein, SsaH family [Glomeribacter sp. 1016415]|nr:type III secretion system protein, SsaH family [Glomeribacter sp. 1016415]
MRQLDQDVRRLMVELGLAAVNHGLLDDAQMIHAALIDLVADPSQRQVLAATMLIGLGQPQAALQLLAQQTQAEAELLRQLLASPVSSPSPVESFIF